MLFSHGSSSPSLLYWGGLVSSAFRLPGRSGVDVTRRVHASLRDRHLGPPMMGSGGCGGPIYRHVIAVRLTAGTGLETDSPHPSSLRGHRSTSRRNSRFLLSFSIFYYAQLAVR